MANVEVMVIDWLKTFVGNDYPVSGDIPKERPASFITVDRTAGPRESMVLDRAEILVEVYHKDSRLEASNKANEIADQAPLMLVDYDDITRCKVNSVVNLGDPIGQYQRYQVYLDVYHRR